MKQWVLAFALLTIPAVVFGQEENSALAAAVKDLATIPIFDQQDIRYVHVQYGVYEDVQAVARTLHDISRASTPIKISKDAAKPGGLFRAAKDLLRVNLRYYAPDRLDLEEFKETWWCLKFDPRFSLLLTRDVLEFSTVVPRPKLKVGEFVVKLVSPHVDPLLFAELAVATKSEAPIVSSSYFIMRALSTIKKPLSNKKQDEDKAKVFETIYGGLYYDFVGIKTGFKKGTDEDNLFGRLLGRDDPIVAADLYDKIKSDARTAVFKSGVTGRARRTDFLRTLTGHIVDGGSSLIAITHDLRQSSIDIGVHPIRNLLRNKIDDAREVIFERQNGSHGFVLFDGEGKRQDEVPADVAVNNKVPFPNPPRLQPAMGCIECHASEGGWRIMGNDVVRLAKEIDIFPSLNIEETDRIKGLYAGDVERKLLPNARDVYASSILSVTGFMKDGKKDQTEIVKVSGNHVSAIYRRYWYDDVDAQQALLELGEGRVPTTDAARILKARLPPVPLVINGVIPEDPVTAALKGGMSVTRIDFDLNYSPLAQRFQASKPKEQK